MKKSAAALCAALVLALAAAGHAETISAFGIRVTLPKGWKCVQGEQVLIYNGSESAAVIVDTVGKAEGESARSVAENLADAVGVKKNEIRRDTTGALSLTFVQNGEPVTARVVDEPSSVLLVYSFGNDAEAHNIACSIGTQAKRQNAGK